MAAVARMERAGVPVDTAMLGRLRNHWSDIKLDLIAAIDKDYGVFEGGTFKAGLFAGYLVDNRIDWPRSTTGHLQLDQDTFRDMAKRYPNLEPLKELRHSLSDLRLMALAVGPDGRNRTLLSPFGARSGRNTPSNTKFVFGPSVWVRGLIKPPPGRALAYVDWKTQEVVIAAALSGDQALLDAVSSGDPYLAFAKMAKFVPPDATKQSHKVIRDLCKTCVLGTNYGMQAPSLALRTGLSAIEAQDLLPTGPDVPGVHRVGRARHRRGPACRLPVDGLWLDVADRIHAAGDGTAEFSYAGQRGRDAAPGLLFGHRTWRRGLCSSARRAARGG